jgi:hypothetical protein
MFPCGAQSAESQVSSLVSFLGDHKVRFGQVWLDIESNPSPGCAWGAPSDNCAWISEALAALRGAGINPGVYASE